MIQTSNLQHIFEDIHSEENNYDEYFEMLTPQRMITELRSNGINVDASTPSHILEEIYYQWKEDEES